MDCEATSTKTWRKFSSMTELSTETYILCNKTIIRGRNVLVQNVKGETSWSEKSGGETSGSKKSEGETSWSKMSGG